MVYSYTALDGDLTSGKSYPAFELLAEISIPDIPYDRVAKLHEEMLYLCVFTVVNITLFFLM